MWLKIMVCVAIYIIIAIFAMTFVSELNVSGTTAKHKFCKVMAILLLVYLLPIIAVRSLVKFGSVLFSHKRKEVTCPRRRKILVIDDRSFIGQSIRKLFPNDDVDHEYRIPEDLSVLDNYDILFVDNQGINNSKYKSGSDLLKEYIPKRENQIVIYHSGLEPYGEFKELLGKKRFYSFTKGGSHDKLIELVDSAYRLNLSKGK